jgi:hypothetical protein
MRNLFTNFFVGVLFNQIRFISRSSTRDRLVAIHRKLRTNYDNRVKALHNLNVKSLNIRIAHRKVRHFVRDKRLRENN